MPYALLNRISSPRATRIAPGKVSLSTKGRMYASVFAASRASGAWRMAAADGAAAPSRKRTPSTRALKAGRLPTRRCVTRLSRSIVPLLTDQTPRQREGFVPGHGHHGHRRKGEIPAVSGTIKVTDFDVAVHGDVAVATYVNDENEDFHGHRLYLPVPDDRLLVEDGEGLAPDRRPGSLDS